MAVIIAVANQKGGVGKTTTAINLAAGLATMNRLVLLVDADTQGNATSGLGFNKQNLDNSLYDFLIWSHPLKGVVRPTALENLELLPTNHDLAGLEVELARMENWETLMKRRLEGQLGKYDYVIIDCPPSLGLMVVNIFTAAHKLLIPMQAEYYSLEGLATLQGTYQKIKISLNKELDILGILITMFSQSNNLGKDVARNVRSTMGNMVLDTVIPRNIRLAESPSYGQPIVLYEPRSSGAWAYQSLTEEVIKLLENDKNGRKTRPGSSFEAA